MVGHFSGSGMCIILNVNIWSLLLANLLSIHFNVLLHTQTSISLLPACFLRDFGNRICSKTSASNFWCQNNWNDVVTHCNRLSCTYISVRDSPKSPDLPRSKWASAAQAAKGSSSPPTAEASPDSRPIPRPEAQCETRGLPTAWGQKGGGDRASCGQEAPALNSPQEKEQRAKEREVGASLPSRVSRKEERVEQT